jgi:hypothetical protein
MEACLISRRPRSGPGRTHLPCRRTFVAIIPTAQASATDRCRCAANAGGERNLHETACGCASSTSRLSLTEDTSHMLHTLSLPVTLRLFPPAGKGQRAKREICSKYHCQGAGQAASKQVIPIAKPFLSPLYNMRICASFSTCLPFCVAKRSQKTYSTYFSSPAP